MTLTKDQWYDHPEFRQELEELLRHPAMRAALDMCKEQGLRSTLAVSGLNLIHYFALQGARKDGYLECLTNLEGLAKPQPTKQPAREPWTADKPAADADKTSAP